MNKILFLFVAALLAVACGENDGQNTGEVQIAPLHAAIDGEAQNRCPSSSITLTAFSQYAESFEWRRDGEVIEGENSFSLTVSVGGSYTVAGVNPFGKGPVSEALDVAINACTTTIAGEETNRCPEETVLLMASSSGATAFEWRKDGDVMQGVNTATLSVHQSGSYTAAAIYGDIVSTPSEPKQVVINQCLFVDAILGEWDAQEKIIWLGDTYPNKHIINISKIDDTTVEISNFAGDNLPEQIITATVDNATRSLTIDYQEIITPETSAVTYLASLEYSFPGDNIGVGIGTLTVEGYGEEMSIVFPSPRKVGDRGGNSYDGTWQMLATDPNTGVYWGQGTVGMETVWTKKQ